LNSGVQEKCSLPLLLRVTCRNMAWTWAERLGHGLAKGGCLSAKDVIHAQIAVASLVGKLPEVSLALCLWTSLFGLLVLGQLEQAMRLTRPLASGMLAVALEASRYRWGLHGMAHTLISGSNRSCRQCWKWGIYSCIFVEPCMQHSLLFSASQRMQNLATHSENPDWAKHCLGRRPAGENAVHSICRRGLTITSYRCVLCQSVSVK